MSNRLIGSMVALAAMAIAIFLLRESPESPLPESPRIVAGQSPESGPKPSHAPPVPSAGNRGLRDGLQFERPPHYETFDFASILEQSLRDAERGSARAQFRASVMLRNCPRTQTSSMTNAELSAKGLPDDTITLVRARASRCSGIPEWILDDPRAASRRLSEAALKQAFAISIADERIYSRDELPSELLRGELVDGQEIPSTPLPADEIDPLLLEALKTADDDRVLRYEAFFLVLGAMDGRSAANGMEADPLVRQAWELMHCRESWECDLPAVIDYLSKEAPESSLQIAIDLARDIDAALASGRLSDLRLH
ncbi:MAG: hypothetical protein ACREST_04395 [Steroidobacteraceae bacterium]